MAKIGRNQPCPCGSGKKHKRCHGAPPSFDRGELHSSDLQRMLTRMNAQETQRVRQQGLGNPIISCENQGQRFVSVNNRLMHSSKWKTFHDFLMDYIKRIMGRGWGNAEIGKPLEERHPILVWYNYVCELQKKTIKNPGKVCSATMTGAVAAYLQLAYDLYALEHNAELQEKLVGRLRNHDNFAGARYEVYVAAVFIRAGFDIDFEDEDDRTSSHCEYVATFKSTGRKFSIEAKHRTGTRFKLGRQLNRALAKEADHTRIVFIDINVPDDVKDIEDEIPDQLRKSLDALRAFEGRIINGKPLPESYLFVTNTPWHHHLESESIRCSVMAEGFQIPDFKGDCPFQTIREALAAREKHFEMHELMKSLRDHSSIPSTFDGEIPEFAFGKNEPRLLIGQQYVVTDSKGEQLIGQLTSATVSENENKAFCAFEVEKGKAFIQSCSMSDDEMAAWRKHPDTFFGEVGQRSTKIEDPLDLYDFFYSNYRDTPRDRLLEFLAKAEDIDELSALDQQELVSVYAERLVMNVLASKENTKKR